MKSILLSFLLFVRIVSSAAQSLNDCYDVPPRSPIKPPPLSPPYCYRPTRPLLSPPPLSPPYSYRPPLPVPTPPSLRPSRPPLSPPDGYYPPPLTPPRLSPPDDGYRPVQPPRRSAPPIPPPDDGYEPVRPPQPSPLAIPPPDDGYEPVRAPRRNPPPIPPPPEYKGHHVGRDRFKLSLQWPNSHCFSNEINDCRTTVPQYFTINGLWAEKHIYRSTREILNNCSTPDILNHDIMEKHKYDLLKFWPDLSTYNYDDSKETWIQQWKQYGSCCSDVISPEPYIESALKLRKSLNMLEILKSGGTHN